MVEALRVHGLEVDAYHAGLGQRRRREVEQDWLGGRMQLLVATEAFSMGVHKDGVPFIGHLGCPHSLSQYAQQIGRGGRNGEHCMCAAWTTPHETAVFARLPGVGNGTLRR